MNSEVALLREYGHEVHLHTATNDGIQGLWQKVATAWQAPYSFKAKKEVSHRIKEIDPDIVHVHNFFPLLTPSIYEACQEAGVPVVQTLHNFRIICPGALLMRGGKVCEDCIQGSPYQAVLHKCYRDSMLGSLAVARMVDVHRRRGTWKNLVDRFLVLTKFARDKFVEAGFPIGKMVVKPNFAPTRPCPENNEEGRSGALFVGRLSPEKGIDTILDAWKKLDISLRIIGEGPLLELIRENSAEFVTVLGQKTTEQVAREMSRAAFLVMPSKWYEGFPMVLVEAFAQGLPAIVSRLGAMAEIVEDGVTGLHFEPGDANDFARKVRWAREHPGEMYRMGREARSVYEKNYTSEINYRRLIDIYEGTIAGKQGAFNPA